MKVKIDLGDEEKREATATFECPPRIAGLDIQVVVCREEVVASTKRQIL